MVKFVTIKRFSELTGYTEKAVRRKIEKGVWVRGIWTQSPDGRIQINLEEYEKWVSRQH